MMLITTNTRINATGQSVTLNGSNATPYMFAITTGIPRSELELKNLTLTGGVGTLITNLGGKVTLTDCVLTGNAPQSGSVIFNANTQSSVGRMSLINTTISKNLVAFSTIHNDGEMILTNSVVLGNSARGTAGIYNGGISYNFIATLILNDSTIADNTATTGGPGGISSAGQLTLTRSTVSGNRVEQTGVNGGGIVNLAIMTLRNSTVSENSAPGFGGGIQNTYGSESTIIDSTVSSNTAGNGGGGISNYGGHLTITNSTLSSNSATDGGGVYNFDSQLTITNSTLSGNTASNRGGGIYNYAPLTLTHVTLAGNSAPQGGGLYVFSTVFTPFLSNTLIVNSSAGGNCAGLTQYLTDNGYNLSSDDTCNLIPGTSLPNTNPNLGLLADNGGPTQTHALLAGSLAIDRIPFSANGCGTTVTTDQRGVTRPQGTNCDIGAYEVAVVIDAQPPTVSNVSATPNPTPQNAPVTLTATLDDRTFGDSNIKSAEYKVDNGDWTPMNAADDAFDSPLESVTATLTLVLSQSGRPICVRGTDTSGNISDGTACTTVTVSPVDDTLPVITPTVSGTLGNNGWYRSDVAVSWAVVDNESGITNKVGCDPATVTTDTTGITFTCSATSSGGTASESVTIKRDTTLPTIAGNASPAANANGWNNSPVTVSFNCTDTTSDIATCTAPQALGEGANQTANGTAADNAGNTASTQVADIDVDLTAPTVSVTGVSDGASYPLGSVPPAGCVTTDNLSGVPNNVTPIISGDPSGLGTFTATCTATDNAGNTGSASVTYQVTSAPPPPPSTFTFTPFTVNQININQRFKTLFLLSNFTLGQSSNGIDPATEPVNLKIANFEMTIPPGSFRKGRFGAYAFAGRINNVWIEALIAPLGNNRFGFQAGAYGISFGEKMTNPVAVILTIGNDSGQTSVNAIIR